MKKVLLIICALLRSQDHKIKRSKVILLMILSLMILPLISGCGFENDKTKIGAIQYMNLTDETLAEIRGELVEAKLMPEDHEYVFFNNMSTMLAALQAGQIAALNTYQTVADYLVAQNQNLEIVHPKTRVVDMFCCAMRQDKTELKKEFDDAINQMRQDGTFITLVKNYISAHVQKEESAGVDMPTFYGAETIKIGVTGDLPKMDYVLPDGIPAGFNTAVLAEISRHIGKNFMLVQVDSGARAAALASGEVDVIFWSVMPEGIDGIPAGFDRPEGMIFTEPYFSDEIVYVRLKK